MPDTDLRYCGYKILGKNVGECALAWWQDDGVVVKSTTFYLPSKSDQVFQTVGVHNTRC